MPCADSFNDIHELKCGQAGEKLEAGGDEKLIFNFIWPYEGFGFGLWVVTRVSIIVARCINLAKKSIQQRRAGWLSGLGLGLVVLGSNPVWSMNFFFFFFFSLTFEKFLSFLAGLVAAWVRGYLSV